MMSSTRPASGRRRARRPLRALAALAGTAAVSASAWAGTAAAAATHTARFDLPRAEATGAAPATDPWANLSPYYEVSTTGSVWPLAGAVGYGSANVAAWHTRVADIAVTPTGKGYWLLTPNGRVAAFGDAGFRGSPHLRHHAILAVELVSTSDGRGYWVVGQGGSVQAFGDAPHMGGLGGRSLPAPIVGLVPTSDDHGYWLVSAAGTATSFGDATALTGSVALDPGATIVGMTVSAGRTSNTGSTGGTGAWMAASDGAVYPLGTARSLGGLTHADQSVGSILATADGGGYWVVTHDGDLHPFGDAKRSWAPVTGFVHSVQTNGDRVVEWAMSQLGKPYRWGGTGPAAFDCSGLSMQSWGSVGVPIPRVAAAQYAAGPKVMLGNLVAGDLVYWATDPGRPATIQHVAIYLGGGQMVEAPYTGQVVSTSWIGGTGFLPYGTQP